MLTAPGLAALMLVITFPLIFAFFTSFYDYTLLHPNHDDFIALENYQEAWEEEYLGGSLWVTVKFVLASVIIEFAIGFSVALALNAINRFEVVAVDEANNRSPPALAVIEQDRKPPTPLFSPPSGSRAGYPHRLWLPMAAPSRRRLLHTARSLWSEDQTTRCVRECSRALRKSVCRP